jgi:hypothetical protein
VRHASGGRLIALALVAFAALAAVDAARAAKPAPGDSSRPAAATAAASLPAADGAGRCGSCHPSERVAFERSRHAPEGVRCVSCHGGDDRTLDRARAHGAGFRGRIARADIPRACASCHSDEDRMRPYNIPVDQLALYHTSGHGKALAAGNTRAAVCSDCHDAHEVMAEDDPASKSYRLNVPRTCGTCHGDTTHAAAAVGPAVYGAYAQSIHAQQLLEKGNRNAPNCTDCHGVHGAAPPSIGDVSKVCGQCHAVERRYFAAGPHLKVMSAQGLAECASCHGDHLIAKSDPQRLATQCATCHGEGSEQQKLGASMWEDYRAAASALAEAEARIATADRIPLPTDDYKARLEQGRTYLREALPAAHSVKGELVASFTGRARSVADEIRGEIDHKLSERRWRYVGLALFLLFVGLTMVLLQQLRARPARGTA